MTFHSKRALVVDDECISQMLLKHLLEAQGYEVTIASCGEEAIACFQAHPYSLVTMDFNMPGIDGIATTTTIRCLEKHTPLSTIVGVTACSDHKRIQAALAAGMNTVLTKPIDPKAISDIVNNSTPSLPLLTKTVFSAK